MRRPRNQESLQELIEFINRQKITLDELLKIQKETFSKRFRLLPDYIKEQYIFWIKKLDELDEGMTEKGTINSELKLWFRRAAKLFHPDINPEGEAYFKRARQAFNDGDLDMIKTLVLIELTQRNLQEEDREFLLNNFDELERIEETLDARFLNLAMETMKMDLSSDQWFEGEVWKAVQVMKERVTGIKPEGNGPALIEGPK